MPTSTIYKKCIIKNVPEDLDIENEAYWRENLELFSPVSKLEIVNVKRLNRRVENENKSEEPKYEPGKNVLINFKGQVMPQHAYLLRVKFMTHHYLPKVKFCTNCYTYSHTKKWCKSNNRCIYCGKNDHAETTCIFSETTHVCINCQGAHLPTDRECNRRKIEQDLRDQAIKQNTTVYSIKKQAKAHNTGRKMFRWSEFPELVEEDLTPEPNTCPQNNCDYSDIVKSSSARNRSKTNSKTRYPKSNSQEINWDEFIVNQSQEEMQQPNKNMQTESKVRRGNLSQK